MEKDKKGKYILFEILWILILLPKSLQMIAMIILLTICLVNNKLKIKLDKTIYMFFAYILVHFIAIVVNSYTNINFERIIAALNTCFIWIVSCLFFCYYRNNQIDKNQISKCLTINMFILITLSVITIIMDKLSFDPIEIFSRNLYTYEWFADRKEVRFFGFMEYSNLIVFYFLLTYPFVFDYIKNRKNKFALVIFTILSVNLVIMTNSRIGMILMIPITFFSFYNILEDYKKLRIVIVATLIVVSMLTAIILHEDIIDKIYEFINSRQGSNSMRQQIYSISINKTIENSILIGNGIKEMYHGYPLGSHSTIIGFFYKTGLMGITFAIIGFITLFKKVFTSLRNKENYMIYVISIFCLMCFMVTEDIDGANWVIVLFFSLMGVICNNIIKIDKE